MRREPRQWMQAVVYRHRLPSCKWLLTEASPPSLRRPHWATPSDLGERVARDGVRIVQQGGIHAKPVAVEATGAVWTTSVEIAMAIVVWPGAAIVLQQAHQPQERT